jgi:hypothetical protein
MTRMAPQIEEPPGAHTREIATVKELGVFDNV